MIDAQQGRAFLLMALLSLPCQLFAATSPFDIDVKELDRATPKATQPAPSKAAASPFDIDVKELERGAKKPSPAKSEKRAKGKEAPTHGAGKSGKGHKAVSGEGDFVRYTIKPGDHIFKILMVHFGLSNEAAEKLIPEIVRVNDIPNIRRLTVGNTLLIPTSAHLERQLRKAREEGKKQAHETASAAKGAGSAEQQAPRQVAAPPAAAPAPPAAATTELQAPPAAKPAPAAPPAPVVPKAAAVPAPAAAPAPAAVAAAPVVAVSTAPVSNTWICSVPEKEPAKVVDDVLNALSLRWSRNRIIHSAEGAPNAFSIRVDRYFEKGGVRYIVSIGENDPYSYTLLRLLESAGYRVLMINKGDDFKAISEKLLRLVGVTPDFGKHLIQGGKEKTGFLVQQDDPDGRRVLITSEPADPKVKWTLPAGCGIRQ